MKHYKSKLILSGAATAIALMAVILSGPRNAFATVIASQPYLGSPYGDSYMSHNDLSQQIGTGLSGNIGSVTLWLSSSNGGYDPHNMRIIIWGYTGTGGPNGGYSGANVACILDYSSGSWNSGDSNIPVPITFVFNGRDDSGHNTTAFDPSKYYVISLGVGYQYPIGQPVTWQGLQYAYFLDSSRQVMWGNYGNVGNNFYTTQSQSTQTTYASLSFQVSTTGSYETPPPPVTDTSTHVISVTPANGTTTATTTTLGQDVYVSQSDLSSTTAVTTTYSNAGCSSFSGAVIDAVSNTPGQGCSFSLTWGVGSSGETSSSTSVTFVYGGTWQYTSTISDTVGTWCVFGYCMSSDRTDLSQVSGSFIVGQPNALDVIQGYIASSSGGLAAVASSSAAVSSLCNPLSGSFSIGSCVYVLIIPDASSTKALINGVSGKFLTYVPLGYVTRFIAIFASGTTTPLPNFVYTPPAVLGYSEGQIVLNPWNLFSTSSFIGSLTSSSSTGSRTLRSIAEPYWTFLWTLVLALAIIGRITGVYPHIHSGPPAQDTATKGRHGMKHVADETYRYKEKLWDMSNRKQP